MKHLLATASVLAIGSVPGTVLAEDIFDLGEIVISASQTPTEAKRTGTTVEVVEEEDLQAAPSARISEVLDTEPGISISGNGGLGTTSTVRVRGLSGQYVPVYIDGIDMTDPSGTQTSYNFGALSKAGIGRIEVLKGSQSAIYGSEAIGGVINITSRRAAEIGTEYFTEVEVGSFNTYSATFGVATKSELGELALTISHVTTDGYSAADENDGNTEADGFTGTTLYLTGAYEVSETVRLGFALHHLDSETDQDGFLSVPPFTFGDTPDFEKATRTGARVYAEIEGETIAHTLSLSFSDTEREYPLTSFTRNFNGERTELGYKGVTQLGATELAFGASYSEESFDADTTSGTYEIASVFAEAKYAASEDLDLSFALRHDDHSTFGSFTTGRIAASWQLGTDTTLRASIGTGFRAPSLFELFDPSFGNPALEQEESRSAEIGIEHRYGSGALVKATAFYTEIDNLIQYFDPDGFFGPIPGAYAQVAGTSRTRGIELVARMPLASGYEVFGSYTYTDAEDASGNPLLRVPEHDFVLGVNADFTDALSGQLVLNHVAGRPNDGGLVMEDYTVLNASITYDFSDSTQGYVRLENLTNEEYQTSAGYGTSDRAVFFGVRASF